MVRQRKAGKFRIVWKSWSFAASLSPHVSEQSRGIWYPPTETFVVMLKLVSRLSRSALLRRTVQILRLHRLANAWLRRRPIIRRLPGSGVIYRATRAESIPLASEMFEKGVLYDA